MIRFGLGLTAVLAVVGCNSSSTGNSGTPPSIDGVDGAGAAGGDGTDPAGGSTGDGGSSGGVAGDGTTFPRIGIENFEYSGAFRIPDETFGEGHANFAEGTLAYRAQTNSVFLVGASSAIAEFAVPDPLGMEDSVASLPESTPPLQSFRKVLDAVSNGNPEHQNRITGMLVAEGQLLVNTNVFYDASGSAYDTTLVIRDASNLAGVVDGWFEFDARAHAAGYMQLVPAEWRGALGGPALTGWASNFAIVSRYSVGPTLFTFDPRPILDSGPGGQGSISTHEHLSYPYGDPANALEPTWENSGGSGEVSSLWNMLARAPVAFIVPKSRTFAVFGSIGGVHSGIGYKVRFPDGSSCGGFCANDQDDYSNYFWLYDVDEIVQAAGPHDPRPYAYGEFHVPFDGMGRFKIVGGALDESRSVAYFTLSGAGRLGAYDYPPLVVAYRIAR